MISAKKLIKLARKWQKMASLKRKRIGLLTTASDIVEDRNSCSCSTSAKAEKGHFVVYSADQKRFVLPLEYLKTQIVMELLTLAEDEFGLSSNGHLTLPCDATIIEYVIRLIERKASQEVEKSLIMSIVSGQCSTTSNDLHRQETSQQLPISGF